MSVFTNPASRAPGQAKAYAEAVRGLLGTRDPLAETSAGLREVITRFTAGDVRQPEEDGKWSATDVVQHLADAEIVWGYRIRLVVAGDRPPLGGWDQDRWAERLRYDAVAMTDALEDFAAARRATLRLLRRLPPEAFERVGVHAERGAESVRQLLELWAGHDLLHLQQLHRIHRVVTS